MIRILLLLAVSVPAGWAADLSVERTPDHRKYDYGGLFLRMPWTKESKGDAISSEGAPKDRMRARWMAVRMDIAGRNDGATLAIMDHPGNADHPSPWRLDGQLGIAPSRCILGDWTLAKGASVTARYRVVVRGGRATPEQLEPDFTSFAAPLPSAQPR